LGLVLKESLCIIHIYCVVKGNEEVDLLAKYHNLKKIIQYSTRNLQDVSWKQICKQGQKEAQRYLNHT